MVRHIATADQVSRQQLIEFLRHRHRALLITHRRDGGLQASPVTAGQDAGGRLMVSSYPMRAKVYNIRRRPEVEVCVLSDEWDGPWVQLHGTAEVLDLPGALEPMVEYYRAISGEHPNWAEYRSAMQQQGKALIRITVEGWGPVATGGFPPEAPGS